MLGSVQCNTPVDLGPSSSVAGGYNHTIALRSNGGVRCWGWNNFGQCNTPADLGPCSSVAGGNFHSIAIETSCPSSCRADLNGHCRVDGVDLGILLNAWGLCPN